MDGLIRNAARWLWVLIFLIPLVGYGYEAPSEDLVLEYAERCLPHLGVLKNSDGFTYIDVDDEYVHSLIQFLQVDGFEEPPYFGAPGLVGAHITAMYPYEMKRFRIKEVEEQGKIIYFTPIVI